MVAMRGTNSWLFLLIRKEFSGLRGSVLLMCISVPVGAFLVPVCRHTVPRVCFVYVVVLFGGLFCLVLFLGHVSCCRW